MANNTITFWGQFENKILESRFLLSVKREIVSQNRIGIISTGIAFLLIAVADFIKLGYCLNFQIALLCRITFFLYCLYCYFIFTPKISFRSFIFHSFSFALLMSVSLNFLIYILNPDLRLDIIDTVVLPVIILMLFVLLQLKPMYLIINALFCTLLYIILISTVFITTLDFIINISFILCVLIIGGLMFMRVIRISQRKIYLSSIQIKQLNSNLKDEVDERIAIQDKLQYTIDEVSSSIQYAKNLQMTFMPSENIIENISKDYFILFKPRDEVSGDFYWINHSDEDTIIAVADCTGHGIPGAFMSILGITLLNKIVKDFKQKNLHYSAADILENLRVDIISSVKRAHTGFNLKDGMDISLCVINKTKKQLQYAGAYNPLWLIRNDDSKPQLTIYKGDNMPIGTSHSNIFNAFTNHSIDLKKNDIIILSTDGFQDQFGGEFEKRFQSKQLRDCLLSMHNKPMKVQKGMLENIFNKWKGTNDQIDDVLLMGIRFSFEE
jgi:serine phosphatase RsbU (regulator of sigma subunit)